MTKDLIVPADKMIGSFHSLVHQGQGYVVADYDSDVDIAGPKYYLIRTAAGYWPHLKIGISVSASGLVQLFENPTVNADGVQITPRCLNREGADATETDFYRDPTSGGDGTEIVAEYIPGGDRLQTRVGSQARRSAEWVLKDNEEYFVKFTADADNTKFAIEFEFYEVTQALP